MSNLLIAVLIAGTVLLALIISVYMNRKPDYMKFTLKGREKDTSAPDRGGGPETHWSGVPVKRPVPSLSGAAENPIPKEEEEAEQFGRRQPA